MFEVDELAVKHTLARLAPVLPPPPARVLEVGCGRGALARALGALGYRVLGVDPDIDACVAAAARGVEVVHADIGEVSTEHRYDVVLFTRSLHHIADLGGTVGHALELVRTGGLVVLEEFARERADAATAGFLYDTLGLLVASGALALPDGVTAIDPDEDPVSRWERERGVAAQTPLHTGRAMLAALSGAGAVVESGTDTEALWRMLAPPGGVWGLDDRAVGALVESARRVECRRISEGTMRAIGMMVTARRVN